MDSNSYQITGSKFRLVAKKCLAFTVKLTGNAILNQLFDSDQIYTRRQKANINPKKIFFNCKPFLFWLSFIGS